MARIHLFLSFNLLYSFFSFLFFYFLFFLFYFFLFKIYSSIYILIAAFNKITASKRIDSGGQQLPFRIRHQRSRTTRQSSHEDLGKAVQTPGWVTVMQEGCSGLQEDTRGVCKDGGI